MRRFKNLIAALVLVSILTVQGCSQIPKQTLDVTITAAQLEYYYEDGNTVLFLGQAELTELESSIVLKAIEQIDYSKQNLSLDGDDISVDFRTIAYEYSKIKAAYEDIRNIVLNHQDEYTTAAMATFVEVDNLARQLDVQVYTLMASLEEEEAIINTVKFADTVIKITSIL